MDSIGCKPSTVKLDNNSTPACNDEGTFEFETALYTPKTPHPPPCESIQSLSEFHGEEDGRWLKGKGHEGIFMIQIHIQNQYYKEMVYKEEYILESLIGESGGYIG